MYWQEPKYNQSRQGQTLMRNQKQNLKVVGEGSITTTPDRVLITLGVITEDKSVVTAQQENAAAITAIIQGIVELGIQENNIQTTVYRIDPQYDFIEGEQVFRGYRVAHLLQVTVDQVELTGTIIDSAVENGANSIASITFTMRDPSSMYLSALTNALENAREKAQVISNNLGVTLNPTPIQVKELNFTNAQQPYPKVLSAQVGSTPIQEGQLTVEAAIEVEFVYFN
ncbi:SIMPL domain-containing protein [Halalkalibacter kiskunsagensis]|uniref:SIMPL domain-containing protein n=1 Tax=Halalkalibacter kiskunsagensis TaxID=1548599 RepID=A0ABV6KIB7_9BACI